MHVTVLAAGVSCMSQGIFLADRGFTGILSAFNGMSPGMLLWLAGLRVVIVLHCAASHAEFAAQDKKLVISVMWAHCITANIPLGVLHEYGLMPHCEGWVNHVYDWQFEYVKKLRGILVSAGVWDRQHVVSSGA